MLTEIYIEALLVDAELADQVWDVWYCGKIDNDYAGFLWHLIAELQSKAMRWPAIVNKDWSQICDRN